MVFNLLSTFAPIYTFADGKSLEEYIPNILNSSLFLIILKFSSLFWRLKILAFASCVIVVLFMLIVAPEAFSYFVR